jgi:hypothetical protein
MPQQSLLPQQSPPLQKPDLAPRDLKEGDEIKKKKEKKKNVKSKNIPGDAGRISVISAIGETGISVGSIVKSLSGKRSNKMQESISYKQGNWIESN